jgi:hypothetical protein
MGFFKAIGNGLHKARDWVYPDEAKLRKVKSEKYQEMPVGKDTDKKKETSESFDAWEEIDNFKMNFFLGSWATKKFKGGIIGEDKVKKELEELEKKRAQKEGRPYENYLEEKPAGQEKRSRRDSLEEELEKVDQKRREKQRRRE